MVVEAAPGFASGEVGDDAVGAVAGGVGDAGEASYAVIVLGPDGEVEADIVQVGLEAAISVGKRMVLTTWLVARSRRRAWGRCDGVPRHPATMRKLTPRRLPLLRPLRQERRPL